MFLYDIHSQSPFIRSSLLFFSAICLSEKPDCLIDFFTFWILVNKFLWCLLMHLFIPFIHYKLLVRPKA